MQRDRPPSAEHVLEVNLDAVNVAATIYVQSRSQPHPSLLPASVQHDPRAKLKYLADNAKKVGLAPGGGGRVRGGGGRGGGGGGGGAPCRQC